MVNMTVSKYDDKQRYTTIPRNKWYCCCSDAKSCWTLCELMNCSRPGFPVLHCLPEFAQTHVQWVMDAIQPSHPLSPSSPAFSLFQHQGLSNESALRIRWPKYWSFSNSPSNEYLGLISFRIDWFDLFAVQGTLKNPQQHSSNDRFFGTQLSL